MAKINRITRSSSSLVTLAELQSGSQLFSKTTVRKTQITPELTGTAAVVKRAELVRRVIDRIIYSDTVSGVQIFADYLLTADSPLLLFIRGRFVDDILGVADDADLLPGKGFDEIINTQEQSKLLIQAFRVFEDAQLAQSRTALSLSKPLPIDNVTITDLPSLEPGINVFDVLQAQEVSKLLVVFGRILEDAVIASEDIQSFDVTKSLQDQQFNADKLNYSVDKTLADLIAEFDQTSLIAGKALADSAEPADLLTRDVVLAKADVITNADLLTQAVSLIKQDVAQTTERPSLSPGKILADISSITEQAAKRLLKALVDAVIPEDLAGVFDGITYNYGLSRAFSVVATDQFRSSSVYNRPLADEVSNITDVLGLGRFTNLVDLIISQDAQAFRSEISRTDTQRIDDAVRRAHEALRSLVDSQTQDDFKQLGLNKTLLDVASIVDELVYELFKLVSLADSQTVQDRNFLQLDKLLVDEFAVLDLLSATPGKFIFDDAPTLDFNTFFVAKNLADTAITEDLAGVFDGITYSYGLGRTETLLSLDDFSRIFSAQRVFEDTQIIGDEFLRVYGKNIFLTDTQDAPTDFISIQPGIGVRDRVGDLTVYIDSLFDLLYNRELGQNFTSSLLFNAASAGSNVQVTSSGTGSGQFEGFYAPAIPSVGPGTGAAAGGNYVLFTGAGTRTLATVPLDTTTGQNVVFTFIAGNTSNGGDRPEAGENLVLEYSTDLGTSYTTTATIWLGATLWPDGANWRTTSIAMPLVSKTTATIWRWRETGTPTDPGDNYGLFNIYVGSTSVVEVRTLPETRFFNIGKGLLENIDELDSVRRAHTAVRGARDGFADVLDLRTYAFPAVTTSFVTSLITEFATTSNAQRYSLPSNNTWDSIAALTTSVFVLSRTDAATSWGVRTTNAGLTWNGINFAASNRKFASDNLAGNTSISVGNAGTSFYKSNDQGASWAGVFTAVQGGLETRFYYPFYNIHRRVWFVFQRDQGSTGGKNPSSTQQWRYFYGDATANTWNLGTFYTTSNTASGLFPIGIASRNDAGSGDMIFVNRNGAVWSLLSSTAIGSALNLSVARMVGWPGEFDPADSQFVASDNDRTYVVLHNNGTVYRASSLTTWYSSSLVGASSGDVDGVFWDPSISSFVIFGETGAGLPTFWTSTTGANWSSSTAILGRAFTDGVSIQGAFVPGTNTTGTSTLVAFELATTLSSIMQIQRYLAPYSYTSIVGIGTVQPTPRFAELPSATFYDVNKTAKQSVNNTVVIKTVDNTNTGLGTQSSVTLTRTSADTELVGAVDLFTRQIAVSRTNELAVIAADAERADITKLLPDTVVPELGGVGQRIVSSFSSITTTTTSVTSSSSIQINNYTTSEITISGMTGFPSFGPWANALVWDSSNIAQASNAQGFLTYDHFYFQNTGSRWLTSKFLPGFSSISIFYIAGNGSNGGQPPSTGENLILEYNQTGNNWTTAVVLRFGGSSTATTWTQTSISLSLGNDATRLRVRQTNNSGGSFDSYGIGPTTVTGGRTSTLVTFATSVSVQTLGLGNYGSSVEVGEVTLDVDLRVYRGAAGSTEIKTADGTVINNRFFLQSSVTIGRGTRSIDDVGVIDEWNRQLSVVRSPTESVTTADRDLLRLTKEIFDPVSVEDSYSIVTDGLTYDSTKLVLDSLTVGLPNTIRVSGSDQERTSFFITKDASTVLQQVTVSERPLLNFIQGARIDEVFSGSGVDQVRGNDLERLAFNVTQLKTEITQAGFGIAAPGIRGSGDDLERTAFDISLRAYRGVDGSITLNTIDPTPDVEFQVSSVTINRGARSIDEVGMLDSFFLTLAVGRLPQDFISVGRSIDDGVRRYTPAINPETVVFAITKLIQDTATPDDFLQTFDGLTYASTMLERDSVLAGLNIARKVSGSDVERTPFDITLLMKQGSNNTVSGVTIAATARGETLFVGQQSFGGNVLGRRNSGDGQERTFFTIGKGISSITVLAGSPSGARNRPVGVSSGTLTVTAESMTLTDTSTLTLLGAGDSSSYSRWYEAQLPWTVIQDFEQTNDVSSTSVYFSRQGYFTFKFNAAPFLLLSAGFGGWFPLGVPYYVICPTPLTFVSSWSGIVGTAPNRTFVFQAQSREFDVPPGSGDTSGYAATLIYEVRFYEDDPRKVGIIVGNNGIVNAPNSVAPPGVYIDSPSTTAKRRAIFTTSTNVNGHAVVQNTSFTVTHVAWDAPGYNDGTQNTSAETIRLTVGKRATVGTDPVILGFGGTNFGARVSGDDLERTVFNIALRAKQGTNNTVSGVTIAAASSSDVVRVGQQYGLIRFSRDAQERISFDYSKTLPAGSNNTVVTATDVFRRVSIFRPRFEEELLALGEKDGNFSYLITQPRRETLLAEDSIIISNLLFRTLETVLQQGDLDPFGNINTMVSNGFLRMTDYVDIEYLDNDYVGESRSFS